MLACLSSVAAEVHDPSSELLTASKCAIQYIPRQTLLPMDALATQLGTDVLLMSGR